MEKKLYEKEKKSLQGTIRQAERLLKVLLNSPFQERGKRYVDKVLLFPKKLVCGGGNGMMFIDCWNNFYFSRCLNFRVILQRTEWPRHQQRQQPQQQQPTVMGMQRLGLIESGLLFFFKKNLLQRKGFLKGTGIISTVLSTGNITKLPSC